MFASRVSRSLLAKSKQNTVRSFSSRALNDNDVVILSATRTPIGTFNGGLASLTGTQLGTIAVKDALKKAGIEGKDVEEVLLGNVISAGLGQAPATQVSIRSGIPNSVPCTLVNKVCASGMKAAMFGAQAISTGAARVVVAGGFESMSNAPYYLPKARQGMGYGHGQVYDSLLLDGLWDSFDNHHMGSCAEVCAETYGFTREDQDKFAVESYRRAAEASKAGRFKAEIVPVEIALKKGETKTISEDEQYTKLVASKVGTLKPAFKPNGGTVTAANASALNDGASALVLASAGFAKERGLKPIARILGYADAAKAPVEFTTAPALAIPKALQRAGVKASDVDFYEINQAFSVVSLANIKLLNLDPSRVDVNGGGVALGHPIGCSGARIMTTLAHVLQQRDGQIGVAAICNGGGGASAVVLERL